jgi:hypothetical protein
MKRALRFAVWLGLTTACGSSSPNEHDERAPGAVHASERRIRLAVADAARPSVSLVDLEDREVIAELDVLAPSRFADTERRGHALLLQADPPGVQALWGGVSVLDHSGDSATPHVHVYKFEPEVVSVAGAELGPAQAAWSRDGVVALLSGASRAARVDWFLESGLEPPGELALSALDAPLPEPTGVAALGEGWFVSGANEHGAGVFMRLAADGTPLEEGSCDVPSGLFAGSMFTVVSCGREVVRLEQTALDLPLSVERWSIAESEPPLVVTGYSSLGTILVRDASGAAWAHDRVGLRALALPTPTCDLALEPARGEAAVALGADGLLRRVSLSSGEVEAALRVTEAFACDSAVRPQLAVAPERAFVSVPAAGLVHDVLLAPLAKARSYAVQGQPMHLSVLGLDPRTRNLGLGDGLD